jgi:4-hydroxythreonine-4-phosphate dehydrogenase
MLETRMLRDKARIAIATGDPAGIGPEISLKAALDPAVRAACAPILFSDPGVIARHAKACGIDVDVRAIARVADADFTGGKLNVLDCKQPEAATLEFGATSPTAGRASIAFAGAAVKAALLNEVDAVVGAPQNETSVAQAGIPFDGHPSFVARQTGTDADGVFMMLCFSGLMVAHATLHQSVRKAIESITKERVLRVVEAVDHTLRQMGVAAPRIAVSGLNPHAGEGGLFGTEEIEIIKPAITQAAAQGIAVSGPFGADTMFHMKNVDAFIVMLHDQGHVPAKFVAPNATIALTIGTPILFSSVAHGSAHDIAGKGIASPKAMIEAILHLSKAGRRAHAA